LIAMEHPVLRKGGVAVITGAASGIGLSAAKRFASLGMKVCLADIDEAALEKARGEVAALGTDTLAIVTDVSDPKSVAALKESVIGTLGPVSLLMNNAVTRIGGGVWGNTTEWRTAMDVNFWGVEYACRAFIPGMIAHDEPAMIIHCGSKQGITNPPGNSIYNITKSALKAYAEALEHELRNTEECKITTHLLVPGMTTTGNRPHREGAWMPDQVIDYMLPAVERGDFYIICPDGEVTAEMDAKRMAWATGDIVSNRPPLSRWHADYKKAFEDFKP